MNPEHFDSEWLEEPTAETEIARLLHQEHRSIQVIDFTAAPQSSLLERVKARVLDMLGFGFDAVKRPNMDRDGAPTLTEIPAVTVPGGEE